MQSQSLIIIPKYIRENINAVLVSMCKEYFIESNRCGDVHFLMGGGFYSSGLSFFSQRRRGETTTPTTV